MTHYTITTGRTQHAWRARRAHPRGLSDVGVGRGVLRVPDRPACSEGARRVQGDRPKRRGFAATGRPSTSQNAPEVGAISRDCRVTTRPRGGTRPACRCRSGPTSRDPDGTLDKRRRSGRPGARRQAADGFPATRFPLPRRRTIARHRPRYRAPDAAPGGRLPPRERVPANRSRSLRSPIGHGGVTPSARPASRERRPRCTGSFEG